MIKCEVVFKRNIDDVDVIVCNGKDVLVFESCGFLSTTVDEFNFDSILEAIKYCLEN